MNFNETCVLSSAPVLCITYLSHINDSGEESGDSSSQKHEPPRLACLVDVVAVAVVEVHVVVVRLCVPLIGAGPFCFCFCFFLLYLIPRMMPASVTLMEMIGMTIPMTI
jgi:hypothetical protein